ncbi:DDE-type integrase/transposase/recombinase [Micromonospora sp. MH33]|uniref:DDE-type integrase/transposase/recombinase n=1 Tax=Micromonospora sp. MH33 TaxID=1945509 RepID=UPI00143DFB8E|nr:DDE-type integrase/transposase/recombinase [Micromonospora sp. MH33]
MWSWDITAFKGPVKGVWYRCYVVIDIYSRYVTGWLVAAGEDAVVARDFLADAVWRNGIEPHTLHADRGGVMVSRPVSEMLVSLGVLRSHSRPRTSNDNPYSEAQFKTMKYVPDFPDRFGSLADDNLSQVDLTTTVAPPLKLRPGAPPARQRAWEAERKQQSSQRISVEHAIAELKWWRQLQRFTGRRELLPETIDAVAGLVSDRMITW